MIIFNDNHSDPHHEPSRRMHSQTTTRTSARMLNPVYPPLGCKMLEHKNRSTAPPPSVRSTQRVSSGKPIAITGTAYVLMGSVVLGCTAGLYYSEKITSGQALISTAFGAGLTACGISFMTSRRVSNGETAAHTTVRGNAAYSPMKLTTLAIPARVVQPALQKDAIENALNQRITPHESEFYAERTFSAHSVDEPALALVDSHSKANDVQVTTAPQEATADNLSPSSPTNKCKNTKETTASVGFDAPVRRLTIDAPLPSEEDDVNEEVRTENENVHG